MGLMADLRTTLLTFAPVTALVGTGATARVRPYKMEELDDLTQPHILIDVDDEARENDLQGQGGLVYSKVDLHCRAMTLAEAIDLSEAVRLNGTNPGSGLAGITAATYDAVLDTVTTGPTRWADGSDRAWFDVNQEYTMSFHEII